VTSVSVIMNGDAENPHFTDAVGKTIPKPFVPPQVASPINLLNPDRYEFYTFNDRGELVKRLMTMKEIQSIVANGNGAVLTENESETSSSYNPSMMTPMQNPGALTNVKDIVNNVQNVLSREMENNKNLSHIPSQMLDTPDVSSSWSQILPAIFGNTGDEILPYKQISMTPDTDVLETTTKRLTTRIVPQFLTKIPVKYSGTLEPSSSQSTTKIHTSSSSSSSSTMTVTETPKQKTTQSLQTTTKLDKTVPTTTIKILKNALTTTKVPFTAETTKKNQFTHQTTTKNQYTLPTTKTTNSQKVITTTQKPLRLSSTLLRTTTTSKARPTTTTTTQTTTPITTQTMTTTKKPSRKPTPAIKRPLTNSPIVIEKIVKKPTTIIYRESEKINEKSVGPTTTATLKTTTEIPSTVAMMMLMESSEKVPQIIMNNEVKTSSSEEDKRNSAINQIIGSLQSSDFYQQYDRNEEKVESKISANDDKLIVEEREPIVHEITTTTSTTTTETPSISNSDEIPEEMMIKISTMKNFTPLENNEIRESIEKLINEQMNGGKTKPTTTVKNVVAFDDDIEDIDFNVQENLYNKMKISSSSIPTIPSTTTTTQSTTISHKLLTTTSKIPQKPINNQDDDDVPTILSDALNNVIELMKRNQDRGEIFSELTTSTTPLNEQPETTTEIDMKQILDHFIEINTQQQQQPSKIEEQFVTTEKSFVPLTTKLLGQKNDDGDRDETTTEPSRQHFTTIFYVEDETEAATRDNQGEFTTEQYVSRSKKDEVTTSSSISSEEESSEIVDDVLSAIGIESDEDNSKSKEQLLEKSSSSLFTSNNSNKRKDDNKENSDEITSVISSLTSSFDTALTTDAKADLSITSKIADGIISVADTISDTLTAVDDESDEITVSQASQSTTEEALRELPRVSSTSTTTTHASTTTTTTMKTILGEVTTMNTNDEMKIDLKTLSNFDNGETRPAVKVEERTKMKDDPSTPMVPMNVIRKDNSLEEINFITPHTPTSTRIPTYDKNYVKIDSIETTTAPLTNSKIIGSKTKIQNTSENVKSSVVLFKSPAMPTTTTTTTISSKIESKEAISKQSNESVTERVPLIEISKPSNTLPYLSSTEDNLVEVKTVQIKSKNDETTSDVENKNNSTFKLSQAIKNNIKNTQFHIPRPQTQNNVELSVAPKEALGLTASTIHLNNDLSDFSKLCNELAFKFWKSVITDGVSQSRSVVVSPFALSSILSMIFLGARGSTSNEMNDLLRLDDMITFNPHVVFRNITESIEQMRNSGVASATFVRELFSDRAKGKLLPYFKEKAQQFYAAHVEEVNFNVINDVLRRRTNLLVRRHTAGKINEYLKTNNIWVNEPLAAISANIFMVSKR
jgi:hypothetical protein